MNNQDQPFIFELSQQQDGSDIVFQKWMFLKLILIELLPEGYIREEEPELPEVSELDIMRHYTLSKRNHGVDSGFYPLGLVR